MRTTCKEVFAPFDHYYMDNFFIAGGFFANLWHFYYNDPKYRGLTSAGYRMRYPGSDVDFYVKAQDNETYNEIVAPLMTHYKEYLCPMHQSDVEYPEIAYTINSGGAIPGFITETIQLIAIRRGKIEDVVDTFDMEHSKISYDLGTNVLEISPAQLNLVKEKKIMFYEGRSKDIAARKKKWIARGWKMYKEGPLIKYCDNYLDSKNEIPF